jgi:hypothetical protein
MTNQYNRYIPIVPLLLNTKDILKNNKCDKFRLTIYSDFIGYHKSGGYANCPVCKNAITNLQYWLYISPHPGHENDSPHPPRETTFNSRQGTGTQRSTQRW